MWKSHGRACVTDATIDCCNKHVTPSMLFPCHYSPDKTAFTFLQCSLQSLSHAALALFFPLPRLLYSFFAVSYTLYFLPNPAITSSVFSFYPLTHISFFFSEQKAKLECLVGMDEVRHVIQCHFLIKKKSSLFSLTVQ